MNQAEHVRELRFFAPAASPLHACQLELELDNALPPGPLGNDAQRPGSPFHQTGAFHLLSGAAVNDD